MWRAESGSDPLRLLAPPELYAETFVILPIDNQEIV